MGDPALESGRDGSHATLRAVFIALIAFTALGTATRIRFWLRGGGRCSLVVAAAPPLFDSGLVDALAKDFSARTGYSIRLVRAQSDLSPGLIAHGEADLAI